MVEANHDKPADSALVFRIGLHLGDLIVEGDDLYGDGVNVATRLEGEAPAGGILISRNVRDAVAGRVEATFEDLGGLSLKNIERPVRTFRVHWEASVWRPPRRRRRLRSTCSCNWSRLPSGSRRRGLGSSGSRSWLRTPNAPTGCDPRCVRGHVLRGRWNAMVIAVALPRCSARPRSVCSPVTSLPRRPPSSSLRRRRPATVAKCSPPPSGAALPTITVCSH